MNWKNMSIPKKIALGFAITVLTIAIIAVLNYAGIGGIVKNASEVIDGNKLKGMLVQREVDHLKWAMEVNNLLTDDTITQLTVETDDHKCKFGKFLYGEERKQAEALVPSLAPIFRDIEIPHRKLHESAIAIDKVFEQADVDLPAFLAEKEIDHLKWMATIADLFLNNLEKLEITTDPKKCELGKWLYGEGAVKAGEGNHELTELIEALKEPHTRLHESAVAIQNTYRRLHPGLLEALMTRLDEHRQWAAKVSGAIMKGSTALTVQTDPSKCAFGKFLASEKAAKWMKEFPELRDALHTSKEPHDRLHASAIEIGQALSTGNKTRAEYIYEHRTLPALEQVATAFSRAIDAEKTLVRANQKAEGLYKTTTAKAFEDTHAALLKLRTKAIELLHGMKEANHIYVTETESALQNTQELIYSLIQETEKNMMTDQVMLSSALNTKRTSTIIGIAGIITGIFIAFLIARAITSVLKRISSQMADGAEQVASASGQVSSTSQSLAEGASEQAASIEETSSSLEEMSSMTKKNADNSTQADILMKEANKIVAQANDSMTGLTNSMEEITRASEETSKIIKTIDEIAFQTNLLALNAAVEAARAGEAGAGFAVVADEVRNLAMRAADAAKSTAVLIEGTVKKVTDGSEIVTKTNKAFIQVAKSSEKIGELLGEISAASEEQADGIEQINKAVTEMDKVTQQNAANAEESASASEEMNAQAEQMKISVNELLALVGGPEKGNIHQSEKTAGRSPYHQRPRALKPPYKVRKGRGKQINIHRTKEVHPDHIIPMDDKFTDF